MMKRKIVFTLDQELIEFLDHQATSRSEYLTAVLAEQRSKVLTQQLITALQEDSNDPDFKTEIDLWDGVIRDGLSTQQHSISS
jgi:hypothetical protein